jgi:hypothetical protein
MAGTFNPKSLLSMVPLDALQGLKPWVGLTANTLMIGGIIDVLALCRSRAESAVARNHDARNANRTNN